MEVKYQNLNSISQCNVTDTTKITELIILIDMTFKVSGANVAPRFGTAHGCRTCGIGRLPPALFFGVWWWWWGGGGGGY